MALTELAPTFTRQGSLLSPSPSGGDNKQEIMRPGARRQQVPVQGGHPLRQCPAPLSLVITALTGYLKLARHSVASRSPWLHSKMPSLGQISSLVLKGKKQTQRERLGDLPKSAQEELLLRALVCGLVEVPGNPEVKMGQKGPYF